MKTALKIVANKDYIAHYIALIVKGLKLLKMPDMFKFAL